MCARALAPSVILPQRHVREAGTVCASGGAPDKLLEASKQFAHQPSSPAPKAASHRAPALQAARAEQGCPPTPDTGRPNSNFDTSEEYLESNSESTTFQPNIHRKPLQNGLPTRAAIRARG